MAVHILFKSRKGPMNIPAPDGTLLRFAGGRFYTKDEEHEAYLKQLADNRQCYVYIDPEEPEVDTDAMSPHDAMKKKIIEEYEREKGRANPNKATPVAPGDTEQTVPPSRTVTSTQGTATPALAQAAKVNGETGEGKQAPDAPSKLEELKKGTTTGTGTGTTKK